MKRTCVLIHVAFLQCALNYSVRLFLRTNACRYLNPFLPARISALALKRTKTHAEAMTQVKIIRCATSAWRLKLLTSSFDFE
ncbi:hypothetical protein KP509_1Z040500 [Ceratopteris richardii]|nr:hypothetical protein KP509_1Z040500 [Ceratopteris richardii]